MLATLFLCKHQVGVSWCLCQLYVSLGIMHWQTWPEQACHHSWANNNLTSKQTLCQRSKLHKKREREKERAKKGKGGSNRPAVIMPRHQAYHYKAHCHYITHSVHIHSLPSVDPCPYKGIRKVALRNKRALENSLDAIWLVSSPAYLLTACIAYLPHHSPPPYIIRHFTTRHC